MSDETHAYIPGQALRLAVDRSHRVRLPEWDVIELEIDDELESPPPQPTSEPFAGEDMGEWELETLEIHDGGDDDDDAR